MPIRSRPPFLFVTGQLPVEPTDPAAPLPCTIEAQAELVFLNLIRIVTAAGYELSATVFARIYISDFDADHSALNSVDNRYVNHEQRLPGRTTVGVAKLGRGARVEIDLTVAKSSAEAAR